MTSGVLSELNAEKIVAVLPCVLSLHFAQAIEAVGCCKNAVRGIVQVDLDEKLGAIEGHVTKPAIKKTLWLDQGSAKFFQVVDFDDKHAVRFIARRLVALGLRDRH